jgi:ABC-type uncharacterized transport system auxiliary subunit
LVLGIWNFRPAAVAVLLLVLISSGCFPRAAADRKYYVIEAVRQGEPAARRSDAALRLRRFEVDAAFATRQLVYRIEEFRYESDYYHQFLVSPGTIIMTQTRDWLEDSGLFARVTTTDSRLASTYTLEANVKALYADFANKSAPEAVVEIRFFLLDGTGGEGSVVLAQTYRAVSGISARTAPAVVEALSRSFQEILTRLEADVGSLMFDG